MPYLASTSSVWKKLDYVIGDIDPEEKTLRSFHKDLFSILETHSEMDNFGSAVRLYANVDKDLKTKTQSLLDFSVWRNMVYHTYRRNPEKCAFFSPSRHLMDRLETVIKQKALNSVVYNGPSDNVYGVMRKYGLIWKDTAAKYTPFFDDVKYIFILEEGTPEQIEIVNDKHYLYPEGYLSLDGLKIWHFLD